MISDKPAQPERDHSQEANDNRSDEIPAQIFADRPPAEWRATAEAARRVAEVMDDTTGQRAFLDFADACEQLARHPGLAKQTRIRPSFDETKFPSAEPRLLGCAGLIWRRPIMARTDVTETKASHEVMDMVRGISAFSHMVFRLRESGLSWRDVKAVIDAERERVALNHHVNVAVRQKAEPNTGKCDPAQSYSDSARPGFDSQGKVSLISGRHGVPRTMRECCDKGGDMDRSRR